MGKKVLIVEDMLLTARLLKQGVEKTVGVEVVVAQTLKATVDIIEREGEDAFSVALVDMHLPDATQGEALDYLVKLGLPCIVFTGEYNDELREKMIAKGVVDYVVKENAASVQCVIRLIKRIHMNQGIRVMVVDDSKTARSVLGDLLRRHQFQVLEAGSGEQALEILAECSDVHMVITDYSMPGMNGCELTKKIREHFDLNRLAIIGLSAHGSRLLSAQFLKNGANDFITKPFLDEEFYCRVTQNVVLQETIRNLEESSLRDHLTELHNRRYLHEAAKQLFASRQRGQLELVVGMLDLDRFKQVNDTHGHDAGDAVLKSVAQILSTRIRDTDILARVGGEEFCIVLVNTTTEGVTSLFERMRSAIEDAEIPFEGKTLRITASIGVCTQGKDSLEAMVSVADNQLYLAKATGRNCVVSDN